MVVGASLIPMKINWASEDKAGREAADEKDLTGVWDGRNHPSRNDDSGEVKLKATEKGYIGTYSDTYNGQLGSLMFKRIGQYRYKGLWWESNLKRYGSFLLEASTNGRTISLTWEALDNTRALKGGKSTWKREAE
jgi:hypothetical protein